MLVTDFEGHSQCDLRAGIQFSSHVPSASTHQNSLQLLNPQPDMLLLAQENCSIPSLDLCTVEYKKKTFQNYKCKILLFWGLPLANRHFTYLQAK